MDSAHFFLPLFLSVKVEAGLLAEPVSGFAAACVMSTRLFRTFEKYMNAGKTELTAPGKIMVSVLQGRVY